MACPNLLDYRLAADHPVDPTGFHPVVGLPTDFHLVVVRPIGSLAAGLPIDSHLGYPIHPVGFLVDPIDFLLVVDYNHLVGCNFLVVAFYSLNL